MMRLAGAACAALLLAQLLLAHPAGSWAHLSNEQELDHSDAESHQQHPQQPPSSIQTVPSQQNHQEPDHSHQHAPQQQPDHRHAQQAPEPLQHQHQQVAHQNQQLAQHYGAAQKSALELGQPDAYLSMSAHEAHQSAAPQQSFQQEVQVSTPVAQARPAQNQFQPQPQAQVTIDQQLVAPQQQNGRGVQAQSTSLPQEQQVNLPLVSQQQNQQHASQAQHEQAQMAQQTTASIMMLMRPQVPSEEQQKQSGPMQTQPEQSFVQQQQQSQQQMPDGYQQRQSTPPPQALATGTYPPFIMTQPKASDYGQMVSFNKKLPVQQNPARLKVMQPAQVAPTADTQPQRVQPQSQPQPQLQQPQMQPQMQLQQQPQLQQPAQPVAPAQHQPPPQAPLGPTPVAQPMPPPLPPAPGYKYQPSILATPLYLGHNPFIEILRPLSYADDNIVTLNLSHSHIYEIDSDAFVGQRFEHIDLSNNKLGLIHSRSFRIGPNHSRHTPYDPRANATSAKQPNAHQQHYATRRPPPAHPKSVTIDFSHNPAIVALSGAFDHIDVPNCLLNFTNSTVELKFGAFKKYFKEHPGHLIDIDTVDCCDQEWLLGYKHNFVARTHCAHDPNLNLLRVPQQTIIDSCIAYVTSARHSMTMPGSGIIHSAAANAPRHSSGGHGDNQQYLTYLILGGTAMVLTSLSIYIIFYMFSLKAAFVYQMQTQKN